MNEHDGKALAPRLKRANLKLNMAAEDIDYRHARGLDKALFQRLLAGLRLKEKQNVLLTGSTGMGKTRLACALAHQACRTGRSAYYVRLPRMLDELTMGRADGRCMKLLKNLAKIDVLCSLTTGDLPYSTTHTGVTRWKCLSSIHTPVTMTPDCPVPPSSISHR